MLMNMNSLVDLSLPISSLIAIFMGSSLISLSISISNIVIAHNIDSGRIRLMAIAAYAATPFLASLITTAFPFFLFHRDYSDMLSMLLPLAVWIALGEFFIKGVGYGKKLLIAMLGYSLFLAFNLIHLQSLIGSIIKL
jgi:hypothetical protein